MTRPYRFAPRTGPVKETTAPQPPVREPWEALSGAEARSVYDRFHEPAFLEQEDEDRVRDHYSWAEHRQEQTR